MVALQKRPTELMHHSITNICEKMEALNPLKLLKEQK